jgi:hypothetical protein
MCINFAPLGSLRKTTAGHQIFYLNNGDIFIFVKKMASHMLKTAQFHYLISRDSFTVYIETLGKLLLCRQFAK